MLEKIEGTITGIEEGQFFLKVGGITYSLLAGSYFLGELSTGVTISISTYFTMYQEGNKIQPLLVGFRNRFERTFFEKFISVSGIGVRAAVKALIKPTEVIASSIACGDEKFLTSLPGIGRTRAKQIIARLQDQMSKEFPAVMAPEEAGKQYIEARAVLTQLGISGTEAASLINAALKELETGAETSAIIRKAMQIRSTR